MVSVGGLVGGVVWVILVLVPVRGPPARAFALQTVRRAETWGVIIVLQSSGAAHLGVDNLNVVRDVGHLLDGHRG